MRSDNKNKKEMRTERMKYDIILAGVGGQGVLSLAAIISVGAMKQGLLVRQSEVHGMAQRGGAVQAHLRLSDEAIESDLVPLRSADMILSMEPIEGLRYLRYLSDEGILITSLDPVKNIPTYPEESFIFEKIRSVPKHVAIRANDTAAQAGSTRATNIVMVGAASNRLCVKNELLEESIRERFCSKGERLVEINLKAFRLGREAQTEL